MTLQGLRVRDALGIGEGSTIPSRFLSSCKGRGLWLQVILCRRTVAGVFQMWRGLQMWTALGKELDWRRAAPEGGGTGLPSEQRGGQAPR